LRIIVSQVYGSGRRKTFQNNEFKPLEIMSSTARSGLKQHRMSVSTVVFMVFCLCAAGAYGIEDMIPQAGPGLTLAMLIVLPFLWSAPMGLVASELGSAIPEEGGFYKWVQRACGEFWGFQAGWWRTLSIYIDNTIYVVLAGSYLASVADLSGVRGVRVQSIGRHLLHVHQHPGDSGRGCREHGHLDPGDVRLRGGRGGWFRELADESFRSLHAAGPDAAAEHRRRDRDRYVDVFGLRVHVDRGG